MARKPDPVLSLAALDSTTITAALREVVTPPLMKVLVGMLVRNAIERRDTQAAKILIERVLGKPRSEPLPGTAFTMPDGLGTAAEIAKAANALLQGVAQGQISPEDAQRVVPLIDLARRAVETQDLEQRIAELEVRAKQESRR